MLAGKVSDILALEYPVMVSPKLDGIRCILLQNTNGGTMAVTRNWNEIPNLFVRNWLNSNLEPGFDGELMIHGAFNEVTSAIMAQSGEPDFFYAVFDYVGEDLYKPFVERVAELKKKLAGKNGHVQIVKQVICHTADELTEFYNTCLKEGYEGVCVRSLKLTITSKAISR